MQIEQLQFLFPNAEIYPQSVQTVESDTYVFVKDGRQHYLAIVFDPNDLNAARGGFTGDVQQVRDDLAIKWCLPSFANSVKLREIFPWTSPQPLGLKKSFGCGDRMGLSASAHIRAARSLDEAGIGLVLAQQSIREMTRTQRTPAEVLNAATWGVFQENYRQPWGADADHLKTEEDIRNLVEAGFTFFTIDPSDVVDDNAAKYSVEELESKFRELENHAELTAHYAGQEFELEHGDQILRIAFTPGTLEHAAVKYERAVAHTVAIAKVLSEVKSDGYDLEMSVDETDSPTSVAEHYFIANELKRRGVKLTSLAIRFIGEFQKGIDYIGDLDKFEASLKEHLIIAQELGPYKISVHSGSDKYSVYPICGRVLGDLIHVKTAGTWYLEALRAVARVDANFFREICDFSSVRFEKDRATYHVIDNLNDLPDYRSCADSELEHTLDNNTMRQMLHVTFGSVLTDKTANGGWRFRSQLYQLWETHEAVHLGIVEEYSRKHMATLGW
jgi:hypothetical protein